MIFHIYEQKKNVIVVRAGDFPESISSGGRIDVWWGRERNNAGLALALGFMMQSGPNEESYELVLKSITQREEEKAIALDFLTDYKKQSRLDCGVDVYCVPGDRETVFSGIREISKDSRMVFMGLKPPNLKEFRENRDQALKLSMRSTTRLS